MGTMQKTISRSAAGMIKRYAVLSSFLSKDFGLTFFLLTAVTASTSWNRK